MTRTGCLLGLMLVLPIGMLHAEGLHVTVLVSGSSVPKVELTIRSLDIASAPPQQFVTGSEGRTPTFRLPSGLYQFTAVSKGFWNSVKEVFVDDAVKEVAIVMQPWANIDYAGIRDSSKSLTSSTQAGGATLKVNLRFVSAAPPHLPIERARVLLRDSDGGDQRWVSTDSSGKLALELPTERPLFISLPMVVLPINGSIYTFVLLEDCANSESWPNFPKGAVCVTIKHFSAEIEIPEPKKASSETTFPIQ
jgi:hypothetical protein